MAGFSYSPNWPTFQQDMTAFFPQPPELSSFHNDLAFSDTSFILSSESNHHLSNPNNGVTSTNLSFHNPIRYPTLSSSYLPSILPTPLLDLTQLSRFTHDPYSSYPQIPNVWPMEQPEPELPLISEIYHSADPLTVPFQGGEISGVNVTTEKRNVGRRLSVQSMAARVRRRKISEKTLELGKLVPGGHKMNTAEMFEAAFKYVKFLQAQIGVLQFLASSPEASEELETLVTSRSVQEKLYSAGKCIVTRTLAKTLTSERSWSQE